MLQDVLILQIGAWSTGTAEGRQAAVADMVTFVVNRQDALALKSAREQGTIEFALRRSGDHAAATTEPVNLEYLNRRFNFRLTR
jgi:Flp pilus assembly protein CpaB